jgi:uncharacterized protein
MKLWSRLKKNKTRSSIAYTIKPRKVKFEWQDSPIDWIPNHPFASYFINEINMILPAGEFWFCRLYNKVLPQISDEKHEAMSLNTQILIAAIFGVIFGFILNLFPGTDI